MMASGINNYAGGSMNEYAGTGMHGGASTRAGPSRVGTRFAAAVRNPEPADPWDQISDEHRGEINDCVSVPSRAVPWPLRRESGQRAN